MIRNPDRFAATVAVHPQENGTCRFRVTQQLQAGISLAIYVRLL